MHPGLYPTQSDDDYHASAGISNSGLRVIGEFSPAHYVAYKNEPREETPAQTTGKRAHCAILEPERFDARFAVMPKFDGRTTVGKLAREEWVAANVGKEGIDLATFNQLLRMRDSVHADSERRRLLTGGFAERSIYANDPITGVLTKCRPDYDRDIGGVRSIVDLKTCSDARPEAFASAAFNYGYYQQAAFYLDVAGWANNEPPPDHFYFIAVEKDPPFAVRVYEASPTMIRRGRDAYRAALDTYAECVANDHWPSYDDGITQLDLPPWVEKRLDMAQNDEIEAITYVD